MARNRLTSDKVPLNLLHPGVFTIVTSVLENEWDCVLYQAVRHPLYRSLLLSSGIEEKFEFDTGSLLARRGSRRENEESAGAP